MPTIPGTKIPPPRDWAEFQDIALSALRQRWRTSDLQQNGRQGQAQAGVDIYGSDDLCRRVGVQCKNTEELNIATVKIEIAAAETFQPPLQAYYVVTTGQRDSRLQTEVRRASAERVASGKFAVGVLFWDDLINDLASNQAEFALHYPGLVGELHQKPRAFRLLCILDLSYLGEGLRNSIEAVFGEFGRFLENPYQVDSLITTLAAAAQPLVTSIEHRRFVSLGDELVAACHGQDWPQVETIIPRLTGLVEAVEYSLTGRELSAFRCGFLLSRWNTSDHSKGELPDALRDELTKALGALLPDTDVVAKAGEMFAAYSENKTIMVMRHPHSLYNEVRRLLLHQGMEVP